MNKKKRTVSIYVDEKAEKDYNFLLKMAGKGSMSNKISRGMELAALEEALHIHLSASILFALAQGKFKETQSFRTDNGVKEITISEDIYNSRGFKEQVHSWLEERVLLDERGCKCCE